MNMNSRQRSRARIFGTVAFCALGLAPQAWAAAGYGVGHESITGAGSAYAGGAAAALDSSTVWYNPAGMSMLGSDEISVGMQLLWPQVDFTNRGSTIFNGQPLTGTVDGKGGKFAPIPSFYWVKTISDRMKFGLGVTAPWGLVTDYEPTWIGRYNEVTTSLKIGNVNPSVSYEISDTFSVGGGINFQYAFGKLSQAIDFGTVCAAALGGPTCAAGFGLQPQLSDGFGVIKGEDFGIGWNIGAHFHPSDDVRFGLHYRSKVKLVFDGKVNFTTPAGARAFLTAAGIPTAFTNTSADFTLTIPEMASSSVYVKVDPQWAVMADVTWTRWSRFKEFRAVFGNPTPPNVLQTEWENVWRYSVGTVYDYDDRWTFRAGLAYDESPILDAFRGPGIPDSDHWNTAVGLSYKLDNGATIDFSYQHLWYKKGPARRPSATGSTLIGDFSVDVDGVGFGVRWPM